MPEYALIIADPPTRDAWFRRISSAARQMPGGGRLDEKAVAEYLDLKSKGQATPGFSTAEQTILDGVLKTAKLRFKLKAASSESTPSPAPSTPVIPPSGGPEGHPDAASESSLAAEPPSTGVLAPPLLAAKPASPPSPIPLPPTTGTPSSNSSAPPDTTNGLRNPHQESGQGEDRSPNRGLDISFVESASLTGNGAEEPRSSATDPMEEGADLTPILGPLQPDSPRVRPLRILEVPSGIRALKEWAGPVYTPPEENGGNGHSNNGRARRPLSSVTDAELRALLVTYTIPERRALRERVAHALEDVIRVNTQLSELDSEELRARISKVGDD